MKDYPSLLSALRNATNAVATAEAVATLIWIVLSALLLLGFWIHGMTPNLAIVWVLFAFVGSWVFKRAIGGRVARKHERAIEAEFPGTFKK